MSRKDSNALRFVRLLKIYSVLGVIQVMGMADDAIALTIPRMKRSEYVILPDSERTDDRHHPYYHDYNREPYSVVALPRSEIERIVQKYGDPLRALVNSIGNEEEIGRRVVRRSSVIEGNDFNAKRDDKNWRIRLG